MIERKATDGKHQTAEDYLTELPLRSRVRTPRRGRPAKHWTNIDGD